MGSVFRFKEFEINQQGCAMKINTDGVLLGALISSKHPLRILDIGTGTGVIAIMLAQQFPHTIVDAVEIDEDAYKASRLNFENSKFTSRLNAILGSFETMKSVEKYDLIVSNPPFYTNSLHNPDARKKLARHADFDFFDKLLVFANENISDHGQLTLILPVELAEYIAAEGEKIGLHIVKKILIKSFEETEVIRHIITLSKLRTEISTEEFIIYESQGVYSDGYRILLKPFFLAF
ncbi:tRNA1(Val) (adenine(37)-N6)-methyltransferase [Sphingobacterium bovistauri]|uniref:tRNA1(Val) (adenine(37)-N6)-methyltransferase n=1 Tax=Sphingobacterium bovistauri TaxID=2781959 RepID=A0ABS7ZBE7_9SPHI|nr:methyltransferase [Sphingobacterium bovistauri]MCA5006205.1 methyltransferase [Sphingobacterium bovistauri]